MFLYFAISFSGATEEEGRLAKLTVVTTDLFPELVDAIRAGKVAATVYQRPLTQGRVALQALYQFLQLRQRIPASQRVVPYVVMRSNLDLVLERLSVDLLSSEAVEVREGAAVAAVVVHGAMVGAKRVDPGTVLGAAGVAASLLG